MSKDKKQTRCSKHNTRSLARLICNTTYASSVLAMQTRSTNRIKCSLCNLELRSGEYNPYDGKYLKLVYKICESHVLSTAAFTFVYQYSKSLSNVRIPSGRSRSFRDFGKGHYLASRVTGTSPEDYVNN